MKFLNLSYETIQANLAADESLLIEAEEGKRGETLRFWENPGFAVVMGSGGKHAEEFNPVACQSQKVPVCRRSSGGGTVVLGPGCLCYSLVLSLEARPYLEGITPSYQWILHQVGLALKDLCEAIPEGSSDLSWDGLKFSGNAQQRKKGHILHHGTLLYGFPTGVIPTLLPHPPREPDYRKGRNHLDFVRNLPETQQGLMDRLKKVFGATEEGTPPAQEAVLELVKTKYSLEEWVYRR